MILNEVEEDKIKFILKESDVRFQIRSIRMRSEVLINTWRQD